MMINSTRSNTISDHNICTNYFKLVRSLDAANSPSSWTNVSPPVPKWWHGGRTACALDRDLTAGRDIHY